MTNNTSQKTFDRIIKTITALLTAILAGVAIWYSIETRNLRIVAETEIELFKKQFDLSVMPDLYPGVISKVTENIMDGKIFQKSGKVQYTKEQFAKLLKYYVSIENIGNRAAYDAFIYIFSADTKSYMKASTYKVFVKPETTAAVSFYDQTSYYTDEKEISDYLKENYDVEISNITNYLKTPEINCMFLFYKDIQDHVYLKVRQFSIDSDENVSHRGVQHYQLK